MKRIVLVQKVNDRSEGPLTPSMNKIFSAIKDAATNYTVEWNGADLFQVKGPWGEQCVVNWTQKICSCRKWEVSGIPCKHVVACIHDMENNGMNVGLPEDYVHESYKLQTWRDVYAFNVNPVNGRQFWAKFDCPTTLIPPKAVSQIGRPPKKRKRSAGEIEMVKGGKLTRQGKTVTCCICKVSGHNKRSCPSKGIGSQAGTSQTGPIQADGGSQMGSQPANEAAPANVAAGFVTPTKRTKKSASRLSPN